MIDKYMRAFVLSAAFAIICFVPPAIAAQLDGNWNMVAVTPSGHCGSVPIELGISHGRIFSTGGRFAGHPIQVDGRVSSSGQVRMNAVAGPRIAHGTGRFGRVRGGGTLAGTCTWTGTGPSGVSDRVLLACG